MARPDLTAVDRDLDAFGIAADRVAGVREKARALAAEAGGFEALLRSVGEDAPPRRPRPEVRRAPALPPPVAEAKPPPAKKPSMMPPPHAGSRPSSFPAPSTGSRPSSFPAPRVETVVPDGASAKPTTFDAPPPPLEEREPGSGMVEVPDEALSSAEMPAVLSVAPAAEDVRPSIEAMMDAEPAAPPPPALDPLELESDASLDLAGAAPLDSMFATIPKEVLAAKPPTQPPPAARPKTDLEAELAALFAEESDPPPPPPPEPEVPDAPFTFDADAHMQGRSDDEVVSEHTTLSRPDLMVPGAPAANEEGDFELEIDEDVMVLEDSEIVESPSSEVAVPASMKSRPPGPPPKSRPPAPKSRPPEPPKSRPPEAPGKGFLNRLLNRKP